MYDESKITNTPTVGLDATYRIGSDKYAGRIVAVSRTGHRCTWQRVDANGNVVANFTKECTRRRNGRYTVIGGHCGDLVLGVAHTDLDQGF